LPEAVVNYLARLGWAHGDAEIFSRDEFVGWFDLAGLSSSPGRFDPDKLKWVNHEHIKRLPPDELGKRLAPYLQQAGLDPTRGPQAAAVGALLRDRAATLAEMADAAHYFYAAPHVGSELIAEFVPAAARPALNDLHAEFAELTWTREAIGATLKAVATRHALKPPQMMMALRILLTGTPATPAIDAIAALLGRDSVRSRMAAGLGVA
jgi:glutamyl-tRNA synthetase